METLVFVAAALVAFRQLTHWAQEKSTPELPPTRPSRERLIIGGAAVVIMIYLLIPRPGLALGPDCRPATKMTTFRAMADPYFWSKQRIAVDREIERELNWPQFLADLERTSARIDAEMEKFYQQFPDARPVESAADKLRAQADAIERRDTEQLLESVRQERLAMLRRCRAAIANR